MCWHRLDERGTGSDAVEGQDGCDDQVEKTENGLSKRPSHRMTIHQQRFSSNSSTLCGLQHEYMVPPYEYGDHADNSIETSDTNEDENHNTWNALLAHDARLQPSDTTEPAGLGGTQGGIVVPLRVGHCVHAWSGKQVSDCRDAQIEWACVCMSGENRVLRNVKLTERQRVRGLCLGWTRPAWVQVHPGRCHSFARALHEI